GEGTVASRAVGKDVAERAFRATPLSPADHDSLGQDFLQAQWTRVLGASASVSVQGYYNGASGTYRLFDDPSQATLREYALDWRYLGGLAIFRGTRGPLSLTAGIHANDFRSTHARTVGDGPQDSTKQGATKEGN